MKKRISGIKLSRSTKERKKLLQNLVRSFVDKGYVVTTTAKAKVLRRNVEKLITRAKDESLNTFRLLVRKTDNVKVAKGLIQIGAVMSSRPGGYTRIIKLGTQRGDNTQKVRLELVEKVGKAEEVKPAKVAKKIVSKTK